MSKIAFLLLEGPSYCLLGLGPASQKDFATACLQLPPTANCSRSQNRPAFNSRLNAFNLVCVVLGEICNRPALCFCSFFDVC